MTAAADTTTYAHAHGIYRRAGWTGPLPLPAGAKWPPPDGFTGWHGAYPSGADSQTWVDDYPEYRDTGQLALRMPDDIVGIDVDHYGDKRGADTLAEAERRWGALPDAPRSSARGSGPSGIRFYRVPAGTVLRTRIGFPELGLGDIEVIQRHHRYAVVWPSTHPSGERYRWYETAGPDVPPIARGLLELPQGWLDNLAGAGEPGESAADPATVAGFARDHAVGDGTASPAGPATAFGRKIEQGASRHDAAVEVACWATREARAGCYPAAAARGALRDAFVAALAEARGGQRLAGVAEARREFESVWAWAVGQALSMSVEQCRARVRGPKMATPLPRRDDDGAAATSALHDTPTEVHVDAWSDRVRAEQANAEMREALGPEAFEEMLARDAEAKFDAEIDARARSMRVDRAARERLAAEDRPPLAIMDVDDFLDAPPPDYLVPGMLYRDGLATVFGAPGAAKSFLVLDVALALATGTSWRGQSLGRGRVHYVMAEGQATNTLRTRAWLHHRGVDRAELRGWFVPIVEPVMLTEAGVVDYLVRVEADRPDLIVLDTKNLMFAGEESKGDQLGAMLRVLHRLRTTAGGCAVVLVDHSGLGDDTRARGSNAQKGGMETEVRVVDDNGIRRAEVTRDKSGQTGATWLYRLHQVEAVARPAGVSAPAVCVEVEQADLVASFAAVTDDWNEATQAPLPADIVDYSGRGRTAVKALARFMRYSASGGVGFTMANAVKAVRGKIVDSSGKPAWSEDTVQRAWGALVDLGRLQVAETGGSTARSMWVERDGDPSREAPTSSAAVAKPGPAPLF